jgi:hypothetical protein
LRSPLRSPLPKCSAFDRSTNSVGEVNIPPGFVSISSESQTEKIAIRYIEIDPGADDAEALKKDLISKWKDAHLDPKDRNRKKKDRAVLPGWSKTFVPFLEHTCRRPAPPPSRIENNIGTSFVIDEIRDNQNHVLVNEVACTAQDNLPNTDRPTAIACIYITKGWAHKLDEKKKAMGKPLDDISAELHLNYDKVTTNVVEITLLCAHEDFKHAGSHMMDTIQTYTRRYILKNDPTAQFYICVADSVARKETVEFYKRMGFVNGGTYKHQGINHRFVKMLRI